MRWLWMGDVPKLTNSQCKELDPDAPDDGDSYSGDKTPLQMAEYIKTNNRFIMNPSWCVCAAEHFWDEYCDEDEDEDFDSEDDFAPCFLLFSKKYPNARFCIFK